jgi:hypothetical protein
MTITLDAGDKAASRASLGANDAANLTTGTLPDARFPATLPAASGENLTALTSANLTGALPAVSGAALTALPATLPASSGVNLTALNGSNISSGTVPVARLGSGSPGSGNFLRGDGSWQAAGGGSLTLIGTQDADGSSAALTQTGLTGFDTYMCVGSDLSPNTASEVLEIRVGDSSGVDSGVNDYAFGNFAMIENGTTSSGGSSADNLHSGVTAQHFNGTEEYCNLVFYVYAAPSGTMRTGIHGQSVHLQSGGNLNHTIFGGFRQAAITLDRVSLVFTNGPNIDSGSFTVYGLGQS